jgi:hypothetical protein
MKINQNLLFTALLSSLVALPLQLQAASGRPAVPAGVPDTYTTTIVSTLTPHMPSVLAALVASYTPSNTIQVNEDAVTTVTFINGFLRKNPANTIQPLPEDITHFPICKIEAISLTADGDILTSHNAPRTTPKPGIQVSFFNQNPGTDCFLLYAYDPVKEAFQLVYDYSLPLGDHSGTKRTPDIRKLFVLKNDPHTLPVVTPATLPSTQLTLADGRVLRVVATPDYKQLRWWHNGHAPAAAAAAAASKPDRECCL